MRSMLAKSMGVCIVLLLLGLPLYVGTTGLAHAESLLAITGTPTEPAPPSNTPAPTGVPSTVPNPTSEATSTPETNGGSSVSPSNPKPNIAIIKSVDQSVASVGDLIGFSIVVTNDGNRTAQGVVVTDNLPDYLAIFDVTTDQGFASVNGQTVTITIGAVPPNTQVLGRIRAYVRAPAPDQGSNTAQTNTGEESTATFRIVQPTATPTLAPTTPPVVEVPTQPVASTPVPTAPAPMPTAPAPRPARLPVTGEAGVDAMLLAVLFGALVSVGLGFWMHQKQR